MHATANGDHSPQKNHTWKKEICEEVPLLLIPHTRTSVPPVGNEQNKVMPPRASKKSKSRKAADAEAAAAEAAAAAAERVSDEETSSSDSDSDDDEQEGQYDDLDSDYEEDDTSSIPSYGKIVSDDQQPSVGEVSQKHVSSYLLDHDSLQAPIAQNVYMIDEAEDPRELRTLMNAGNDLAKLYGTKRDEEKNIKKRSGRRQPRFYVKTPLAFLPPAEEFDVTTTVMRFDSHGDVAAQVTAGKPVILSQPLGAILADHAARTHEAELFNLSKSARYQSIPLRVELDAAENTTCSPFSVTLSVSDQKTGEFHKLFTPLGIDSRTRVHPVTFKSKAELAVELPTESRLPPAHLSTLFSVGSRLSNPEARRWAFVDKDHALEDLKRYNGEKTVHDGKEVDFALVKLTETPATWIEFLAVSYSHALIHFCRHHKLPPPEVTTEEKRVDGKDVLIHQVKIARRALAELITYYATLYDPVAYAASNQQWRVEAEPRHLDSLLAERKRPLHVGATLRVTAIRFPTRESLLDEVSVAQFADHPEVAAGETVAAKEKVLQDLVSSKRKLWSAHYPRATTVSVYKHTASDLKRTVGRGELDFGSAADREDGLLMRIRGLENAMENASTGYAAREALLNDLGELKLRLADLRRNATAATAGRLFKHSSARSSSVHPASLRASAAAGAAAPAATRGKFINGWDVPLSREAEW